MTLIVLPIRDFALPVPRVGSIEMHSGFGRASEGQEIHQRVQAEHAKADDTYEAEVKLSHDFERGGYTFRVSGRADGLYRGDPSRIEEIKSGFNVWELKKKLSRNLSDHPYCLQLRTYGYFYWLQHQVVPSLVFHLVSTRNYTAETLDIALNPITYEQWLDRRLDELVRDAERAEKLSARRRVIAESFPFPFEKPRPGQVELIRTIEEGSKGKHRMLVQAPTGLGKTVGVLFPALKEALARGQKVIYVTPKNSQHSVAEDAISRFRDKGSDVRSLTLTAKSKICFKNEPLCNPEYCEFAKDHYTKVHESGLADLLARETQLTAQTFRDVGERYQVCPFELQLDAAKDVETVICDYNYVFAPRTSIGGMEGVVIGQEGKPNLVIDEAHNLLSRAMDYYSPALSTFVLERMRPAIRDLPKRYKSEAESLLNDCLASVQACRPKDAKKSVKIDPPAEVFLEQDASLRGFLSKYLDSTVDIQPRDPVLRLCFYWSEFTAALEFVTEPKRPEFFTTFQIDSRGNGTVKITCCDASKMLEECYDDYDQVVGFSATLKPFEYYAKLSGLKPDEIRTAEFSTPFAKSRRKLLIIPQISTKYSDREKSYAKVSDAIRRIAGLRKGNYFAFFPSFEFLSRVLDGFSAPPGFMTLRQEREMKASEIQSVMDHLRRQLAPTIVFAVQGGVFSEGVDYPGEMVIGAFVIGPPLPSFDLEREEMREYYEKNYGAGFDYAYTYPRDGEGRAGGGARDPIRDRSRAHRPDGQPLHPYELRAVDADRLVRRIAARARKRKYFEGRQ